MGNTLTDIYNDISDRDAVYLEKHAEHVKLAEEEDAAGRIMARGFADELHKLAAPNYGDDYGMKPRQVRGPKAKKLKPAKFKVGDTVGTSGERQPAPPPPAPPPKPAAPPMNRGLTPVKYGG